MLAGYMPWLYVCVIVTSQNSIKTAINVSLRKQRHLVIF